MLSYILPFVALIVIVVFIHEYGHYYFAKRYGVGVTDFSIGFGKEIFGWNDKSGTRWKICVIPLGGYVKISGMIDESMDTEHLKKDPQPWEFRSKPAWQRLIIMLGGVTVNIILGFAIYIMITFVWGKTILTNENLPGGFEVSELVKPYGFKDGDKILQVNGEDLENVIDINKYLFLRDVSDVKVQHIDGSRELIEIPEDIGTVMFESGLMRPFNPLVEPIIDSIVPSSPAENAGFQTGDRIVSVNGNDIVKWQDFTEFVSANTSPNVNITVSRNRDIISKLVPIGDDKKIGVSVMLPKIEPTEVKYSFTESLIEGSIIGYWTLIDYVGQFKYIFTQEGASQLGGFGTIGNIFPSSWNWRGFWETTALLSIILAFMNALPIPALDGGHVMFLFYEMIVGKKPNTKVYEFAQMVGFFLLIALVLYANAMDVVRFFFS